MGMSSWAISLHPLLLEKAILMDKAGESSGRPLLVALVALSVPRYLRAVWQSAGAECSPLWPLKPQSASHLPL